ncbi:MAG TPA: precorrin-6y C5,15-methyltransferase (decarboxylating) subunit CbiE [Chitinophaga sp.]|uniref:precorrin-6y C5,15-methyltransferase (decarboxylating) subunit CbiE n=1 Tax=Chitinophaga sp. TaxID=1869181 RepID=UPI002BB77D83|nr:precorrin-6y C5,15-methyltransferase (decarboxylating) subunit CbiE [Chitinophaga sp.]HVI45281.1 precorrin-6y C5,15-methyltransferase (decarboxylating) subunit CbiE [Chitinophaga sp.]
MKAKEYIVIGVANTTADCCAAEALPLLYTCAAFSGGDRHYQLVKHLLPEAHTWIPIKGGMSALFEKYAATEGAIAVFASGDPLFYGMVQTILKYDPAADIKVYPQFNSIQRLCTRVGQPYESVKHTSVHGRGWQELDAALIQGEPLIAVLTDATRSPRAIAQRMLDYGFTHYEMLVGEDLDGIQEHISRGELTEMSIRYFHPLNCALLRQVVAPEQPGIGIADHLFEGLPGRPNMITKKAVRLYSLSQLDLHRAQVCWDIGFCTGAVAIEARRLYPHLQVVGFEKRPECAGIIERNMRHLSAPGIEYLSGDFFEQNLAALPAPDAVFIGGHGNRLPELMQLTDTYMRPRGRIVMNAVLESSITQFCDTAASLGWELLTPEVLQVGQHNPITVLTAIKTS